MHGPSILTRTLSIAIKGSPTPYQYGNAWQYHSRSDRHSKIASWGLLFDLLRTCSLLRTHVTAGKVGIGINHEMRDFGTGKKKNLDLVICHAGGASQGSSRGGTSGITTFADLVGRYGLALDSAEVADLAALPSVPIVGVSTVLVAIEAKAAMTAHLKARPRLKDELTASYQTIHGDTDSAIAGGIVMINAAESFISPDQNKFDLSTKPPVISPHKQPRHAEAVLDGLRDLRRRSAVGQIGFDAIGVVVVDCKNDGSPVTLVTKHPPAPAATDDFDYRRFVARMSHQYSTRFSGV